MRVHVLVGQMTEPAGLQAWVSRRLHEVLGPAVAMVEAVAVVMNPVVRARHPEPVVRCSMVVTTTLGRRVVETRDAKLEAALERAMRLVSLSLFAETPAAPAAIDRGTPPLT